MAAQSTSASWPRGVDPTGRYLVDADGKPFFWLGDTAWLLSQIPNREDAEHYLAPPDVGTLASLDPALILAPPRGMEAGYIPIANRQELAGAASRPHDQGKAR